MLKMDFMPDNLRWGDDGQLWVIGATGSTSQLLRLLGKAGMQE